MLGFAKIDSPTMDRYCRKPQPSNWSATLLERDGESSGASVTIYRSIQYNSPGAIFNPHTREIFEQKLPRKQPENYSVSKDMRLLSGNEASKELLVIVKRGRHADIVEQDSPPYLLENDIRRWANDICLGLSSGAIVSIVALGTWMMISMWKLSLKPISMRGMMSTIYGIRWMTTEDWSRFG